MNWRCLCLCFIILSGIVMEGHAQFGSNGLTNAKNVGMANTYTASSHGLYSVGVNPGLLNKIPGGEEISILFPSLNARGYGVSKTLSAFNYYAGIMDDKNISKMESEDILQALKEGGTISLSAVVGFFSVSFKHSEEIGTFAFTVTDYISSYLHFPGFVADLVNNESSFKGSISLDDFSYKSWWIRSYGLSYSRRLYYDPDGKILQSLSGGASLKFFNGFIYQDIVVDASTGVASEDTLLYASIDATSRNSYSSDLTFLNIFTSDGKEPDNFLFPKAAGKRMGLDLGFSAEFAKGITLGLAMTDIGKLEWNSNAGTRQIGASFAILGNLDETLIDSISSDAYVSERKEEDFTTSLPTALRAGLALQINQIFTWFPGKMKLAFDFNKGLSDEPSNLLQPRYSIGMEYQPWKNTPIILSGVSFNHQTDTDWALGLGFDVKFMDFYIATIDMIPIISGSEMFSISAIFNWKINYRN